MATVFLTGLATSLADGNWSGTPADDDRLEIREGSQTISSDLTAQADEDIAVLWVGPQFTGSLGSPSGSADFNVESNAGGDGRVYLFGASDVYLTTTSGIDNIEVHKSGGQFHLTGGTTVNLFVFSGTVKVGGSAVVTNLYVYGGDVEIADNATAPTLIVHGGGTIRTARDVATYTMNGGNLYAEDTTGMTTLNLFRGTANLRSTGTFTTVNHYGGVLTPAGALTDVVITTLTLFGTDDGGTYMKEAGGVAITAGTTNFNGNRSAKTA